MEDVRISLPHSQQAHVDDLVASGQYPSVSDYVADLIRADQKAKAHEKLEALLLEGLDSGPATSWSEADSQRLLDLAKNGS